MVIIGDSFVRGTGAADLNGWAQRLSDSLSDFYEVYLKGHGGHTILDILDRLERDALNYHPDLVILQVGTNDSRYRPSFDADNEVPSDEYRKGINDFITRVRECCYPHTHVVALGTTPVDEEQTRPYKEDKHYINSNLHDYDDILSDVCRERQARYVKLFEAFSEERLEDVLADGVHPNDTGHQLIHDLVLEQLSTDYVP